MPDKSDDSLESQIKEDEKKDDDLPDEEYDMHKKEEQGDSLFNEHSDIKNIDLSIFDSHLFNKC